MKFSLSMLASVLLILSAIFAQAQEPAKMVQADDLLKGPKLTLQQANQALILYEEELRHGRNSQSLLPRLSRTAFILGNMAPKGQRAGYYERGLAFAGELLRKHPHAVAGHYWKAINLCGLVSVGGRFHGLKLLPKIVAELKQSLALDETYDQAGAHRVLGRIYYEAPPWPISVGDPQKSLRHLTAAVHLAPHNSTNHLYLAETLLDLKDVTQARQELEKALQANQNAISTQDLEEDHRQAQRLLTKLDHTT